MKIQLAYQEPETNIGAYKWNEFFTEEEINEAVAELEALKAAGYEITIWRLVPDDYFE